MLRMKKGKEIKKVNERERDGPEGKFDIKCEKVYVRGI